MLPFGQITAAAAPLCGNWTEICFQFVSRLNCIWARLRPCGAEERCGAPHSTIFGGLTVLPVILVSPVTLNRLDSFRSVTWNSETHQPGHANLLQMGGGSVDFQHVRFRACSLRPGCFFMYKVSPESIMHSLRMLNFLFSATLQRGCRRIAAFVWMIFYEPSVQWECRARSFVFKGHFRCSACFRDTEPRF